MEQQERIGGRRKSGPAAGMIIASIGCVGVLIVATLGGLGYFVFGTASYVRPSAQRSVCLSNMKQLAAGLMMYSQDYDGKFPIAARWDTDLMPYIKNVSVLRCPSRPSMNGYAFNSRLSGIDANHLSSAAAVPMLFESSVGSSGTADPLTSFLTPHDGSGGIAFADGHVKLVTSAPEASFALSKQAGK